MSNEIATYLKYANLQMAAEARLDLFGNQVTASALTFGNDRSSKFTAIKADQFIADGWAVVEHKSNTATGFSGTLFKNTATGELVLSFRSTEFADDAARDNQATNGMEIRPFGYAFGQIADMQKWYQSLRSSGKIGNDEQITVTGYSLGGHLAAAFSDLYGTFNDTVAPGVSRVRQTFTFNGAGIGKPIVAGLNTVIQDFNNRRLAGSNLDLFSNPEVRSLYLSVCGSIRNTDNTISLAKIGTAVAQATALANSFPTVTSAYDQAALLLSALTRSRDIAKEAIRVDGLNSGNGNNALGVALVSIEAVSLDYQLAVLQAGRLTSSYGDIDAVGKANGTIPRISEGRLNYFDIYGDTSLSMVSNSQRHLGTSTPIWIEDQPELRGSVYSSIYNASSFANGIKLLVPNFSQNDFGDTHSLVLLVDSLSVQNMLSQLAPSIDTAALKSILNAASNAKVQTGFGPDVGTNNQGKADGDSLEKVVNNLARFLGISGTPLVGRLEGGTWADINDRNPFYARLKAIQDKITESGLAGKFTLTPIHDASIAKTDFAALISLITGATFSLQAKDEASKALINTKLGAVYANEFALFSADQANRAINNTSALNYTDNYLNDRSALLNWQIATDIKDTQPDAAGVINQQGTATYTDINAIDHQVIASGAGGQIITLGGGADYVLADLRYDSVLTGWGSDFTECRGKPPRINCHPTAAKGSRFWTANATSKESALRCQT